MYCKLRQAFPQNYTEATTAFSVGGAFFPIHKAYVGIPNLIGLTPEQQSGALLYVALSTMGAGGNAFEMDSVNSAKIDIAPGVTVFKDGWNNPVGFKRFVSAVQLPELNNAPYTNTKNNWRDPFDPQAKLSTLTANWTLPFQTAAQTAVVANFDNNNKTITAFSAGEDKTYNSPDDVFGYRLRKLGNKGTP